jgi:hypothetical protein
MVRGKKVQLRFGGFFVGVLDQRQLRKQLALCIHQTEIARGDDAGSAGGSNRPDQLLREYSARESGEHGKD